MEINQPRDSLDDRQKCQEKGAHCSSFFDVFRGLYALKNSSINLRFLSIDNPL